MISLHEAISFIRPGAHFVTRGDVVEWHDTIQSEPTKAEIEAARTSAQPALYKTKQIQIIKTEAGRRIVAAYPLATGKQSNMIARMSELMEKRLSGIALTIPETAEQDALRTAWNWIKSVRTESRRVETAIGNATDKAGVDLAVSGVSWPTVVPPEWPL